MSRRRSQESGGQAVAIFQPAAPDVLNKSDISTWVLWPATTEVLPCVADGWPDRYLPKMEIDAQTYSVRADGQLLTCEAAVSLPMTQRYFLF